MEIEKSNKFKKMFKRYGVLGLACVFSIAIALTIAFTVPNDDGKEVGTDTLKFGLPMSNAVIIKDYADDRLQFNESLNRWEIHLALDLSSENAAVYSICDGVVSMQMYGKVNSLNVSVATGIILYEIVRKNRS